MRKVLSFIFALAMLLLFTGCSYELPTLDNTTLDGLLNNVQSQPDATETSENTIEPEQLNVPKYSVQLELSCIENLMFSKYDIDIFVDNNKIGMLDHGTNKTFTIEISEGTHTLTVTKKNDISVDGNITFSVSQNTYLSYEISCTNDQVKVESSLSNESTLNTVEIALDITQFNCISSNQLVEFLGEPDNITKVDDYGFAEIPATIYDYENHELGFLQFDLINDKVAGFTVNGNLPYNEGDILPTLNITEANDDFVTEGDLFIKWQSPTDDIDLIHAALINKDNNTYASLSIQYDSSYYTEWSLPIDYIEQGLYRSATEENVKKLLLSPSSADFPWFDWTYKKNDYYVLVESYVDAQNAFGAELRNNFTFIYSIDTGNVVYAVLDGEVIIDDYIETEDIIKDKVDN